MTPKQLNCKGNIIILAMIYIVVLGIIGLSATQFAIHQKHIATRNAIYTDELAAAEYAVNKLYAELDFLSRFLPPGLEIFNQAVNSVTLPQLPNFQITADIPIESIGYLTGDPTGDYNSPLVYNHKYRLSARAKRIDPVANRYSHPGVQVEQLVYVQYIPLNLFGIYANIDWEIIPGEDFSLRGKLHSNKNIIFDSDGGKRANYYDRITVAGNILGGAGHVPGRSDRSRLVNFTYNGSALRGMYENGRWIDHLLPDWKTIAEERWNGYVRDSAHGVQPLDLPIPWTQTPDAIIDRISADDTLSEQHVKFEWLAGLRIVRMPDGTIRGYAKNTGDADWQVVPLQYPNPSNPQQTKRPYSDNLYFYDNREDAFMRVLELNVQNLREYTQYLQSQFGIQFNGIVYLSEESDTWRNPGDNKFYNRKPAIRVTNGANIPQSGLIVATDDTMYVKGDFNLNKAFALIAGDSINILSNAWQDSQNNAPRHNLTNASSTETNAIFIGGITPTAMYGTYSGGAENYFRYLEHWSGKTHAFNGSIICMFASRVGIGVWEYGGKKYTAPKREWAWDSLGTPLQGTPYVRRIVKSEWKITSQ